MKIKNFRDLNIWKLGKEIVLNVYRLTKNYPQDEKYSLVNQMRRASVSIPSNIAESFNRYHNKEYRQFLFLTLGSCAELETQVEISNDLKYLNNFDKQSLLTKIEYESRMIRSLIKKL